MNQIHFISGLPRSGSTLLAALLAQNPRFRAGMSGPLAGMFGSLLGEMSGRNEFSVFIDDVQRQRLTCADLVPYATPPRCASSDRLSRLSHAIPLFELIFTGTTA
jgi:hypothetical protein